MDVSIPFCPQVWINPRPFSIAPKTTSEAPEINPSIPRRLEDGTVNNPVAVVMGLHSFFGNSYFKEDL